MSKGTFVLSIVTGALAIFCANSSHAASGAAHASKEGFVRASDALLAELGTPGQKSVAPSTNSPIVQNYLKEAEGLTSDLGTTSVPVGDLNNVGTICGRGAAVLASYLTLGTGPKQRKSLSAQVNSASDEAVGANARKHLDVVLPTLIFNQHCMAVYMPLAESLASSIPKADLTGTRLRGVRELQSGGRSIFEMIEIADLLTSQEKDEIILHIENDFDGIIIPLVKSDRVRLKDELIRISSKSLINYRGRIAKLVTRIDSAPCRSLCSI